MIKHVDTSYGYPNTIGYIQLIEWVSIDYDEPHDSGQYLVADGDGHTRKVDFAYDTYDFQNVIFGKFPHVITNINVYWHDNGKELSASELISVVNCGHVWYYTGIREDIEGCSDTLLIAIMTTSDFEFWINSGDIFHGPTKNDQDRSPIHTVNYNYVDASSRIISTQNCQ